MWLPWPLNNVDMVVDAWAVDLLDQDLAPQQAPGSVGPHPDPGTPHPASGSLVVVFQSPEAKDMPVRTGEEGGGH